MEDCTFTVKLDGPGLEGPSVFILPSKVKSRKILLKTIIMKCVLYYVIVVILISFVFDNIR